MKTATFVSPDIHCAGCVASIQRSLRMLPGVDDVSADLDTKTVIVRFNESRTNETTIEDRLEAAGYPVER